MGKTWRYQKGYCTKFFLLTSFFFILLASGCVTSTSPSAKSKEIDPVKALDNRLQLALGYMGQGNHERAREHLNKALEINSRSPELHDIWALLYQRENELDAAEQHHKKALSYDANFTRGRNNYGLFLLRSNRIEEAYQQFLMGTKDLGYSKRAELFYKVGITALRLNKKKEAEEAFTKAAILRPTMSVAYLELAELTYAKGDYTGAKQILDKYNATKSGTSAKGLWLGIRLEHQMENRDAEASLAMALRKLYPDSEEHKAYQRWLDDEQRNR